MQTSRSAHALVRRMLTAGVLISLSLAAQGPPGEDTFSSNSCETPDRNDSRCPKPRFGWADCPGQRGVPCDICYGPNGPFAAVPRTNPSYKLSSGCDALSKLPPGQVIWINQPPAVRDRIEEEGGSCWPEGGYILCKSDDKKPASPPPSPEEIAAEQIKEGWSDAGSTVAPGVSYTSVTFGGDILHAVRLSKPFVISAARTQITDKGGKKKTWQWSGKTVYQFAKDAPGATGGVTGTLSGWPASPPNPAGPVVSEGKLVEPVQRSFTASGQVERSFLGHDGRRYFIRDLAPDPDFASYVQTVKDLGAQEGLGGLGRLLDGGEDVHERAQTEQGLLDQASDKPNARAVAGTVGEGSGLILLVQQGVRAKRGAGMGQLAKILKKLDVEDAVILDGGGSAEIVVKKGDEKDWTHGGAPGRKLPTAILF